MLVLGLVGFVADLFKFCGVSCVLVGVEAPILKTFENTLPNKDEGSFYCFLESSFMLEEVGFNDKVVVCLDDAVNGVWRPGAPALTS